MRWDLPAKSPIASSSWTPGKSSKPIRRRISSPIRSTRGPSCFSVRFCGERLSFRHCEPPGRRKAPPDDRLREAIQKLNATAHGLLRRFAPRNDEKNDVTNVLGGYT